MPDDLSNVTINGCTDFDLAKRYGEAIIRTFPRSKQREELEAFFDKFMLPQENLKIDKAVAIGFGSFCYPDDETHQKHINGTTLVYGKGEVAMNQFAAFEFCIEKLQEKSPIDKKDIAFIDQTYNDLDNGLLRGCGYTNINNTELTITPETFIFTPWGYETLGLQEIIEKNPALMISHSLEGVKHARLLYDQTGRYPQDFGSIEAREAEMKRRRITRPFQSTHLFRPLWRFTNKHESASDVTRAEDGVPTHEGIREPLNQELNELHPALTWCPEFWVFWTPDNKSALTKYEIQDDMMKCTCFECQKNMSWVDKPDYEGPVAYAGSRNVPDSDDPRNARVRIVVDPPPHNASIASHVLWEKPDSPQSPRRKLGDGSGNGPGSAGRFEGTASSPISPESDFNFSDLSEKTEFIYEEYQRRAEREKREKQYQRIFSTKYRVNSGAAGNCLLLFMALIVCLFAIFMYWYSFGLWE